jgi:hypothetical protein
MDDARQSLPASEIEALCLVALQRSVGLKHIHYAKIRPYNGPKSWTWELETAGPNAGPKALVDAMPAVHRLQQELDLDLDG